MYSKDNNWLFLDKNKDYLEELELELNGNNENTYKNDLVLALNKIKNLKKLKIIGGFNFKRFNEFQQL